MVRALERAGWVERRRSGSHAQFRHPSKPGRVTVPMHARVTLNPKTLATILDQAGLTVDELRDLL